MQQSPRRQVYQGKGPLPNKIPLPIVTGAFLALLTPRRAQAFAEVGVCVLALKRCPLTFKNRFQSYSF